MALNETKKKNNNVDSGTAAADFMIADCILLFYMLLTVSVSTNKYIYCYSRMSKKALKIAVFRVSSLKSLLNSSVYISLQATYSDSMGVQ